MKIFRSIALFAALAASLAACRELPAYLTGEPVVARAGKAELTAAEVGRSVPSSLCGADSAAFADLYVDRWVKRMLKVREAEELFSESASDIEKQVEEFRQSLLVRKVDQYYVDRSLDTLFTEEDIRTYYDTHAADFALDRTLVKGRAVRFPDSYRQASKLYSLMSSPSEAKQRDFKEICAKNDFRLVEWTSSWADWSDFLSELPVAGGTGAALLRTGKVQTLRDTRSIYYFEITDILRPGDRIPIERLTQTIRRILLNARQTEIIRAHEEELYRAAEERREVVIHSDRD